MALPRRRKRFAFDTARRSRRPPSRARGCRLQHQQPRRGFRTALRQSGGWSGSHDPVRTSTPPSTCQSSDGHRDRGCPGGEGACQESVDPRRLLCRARVLQHLLRSPLLGRHVLARHAAAARRRFNDDHGHGDGCQGRRGVRCTQGLGARGHEQGWFRLRRRDPRERRAP
jgi:hypothetical protein